MKKIVYFILIVFTIFLSSCKGEVIVTEMIANYDYGNISFNNKKY